MDSCWAALRSVNYKPAGSEETCVLLCIQRFEKWTVLITSISRTRSKLIFVFITLEICLVMINFVVCKSLWHRVTCYVGKTSRRYILPPFWVKKWTYQLAKGYKSLTRWRGVIMHKSITKIFTALRISNSWTYRQ